MKQSNKKPLVFYVGLVILGMVMITTHFTSGLYARFISTSSISDSAVIAKFCIGEDLSSSEALVDVVATPPVTEGEKQQVQVIQITNTGDTTVTYTLQAQNLTNNLPIRILFGSASEAATTLTGTLAPNETINQNLQIEWGDTSAIQWTQNPLDPQFAGRVDLIRLTVSIQQTN